MKHVTWEDVKDQETYDENAHSDRYEIANRLRSLLNYVEDRRIDHYIYTNAPGYKPYYKALYDTYFNSKIVDKGLKSSEHRDETWESYMFRLINITNENRDLDALNGLRAIWKELDLGNVSRLKSTDEAYEVAKNIYHIIDGAVHQEELDKEQEGDEGKKGKKKEDKDCQGESSCSSPTGTKKGKIPQGKAGKDDGSKAKGGEPLSSVDKNRLDKAIEKQKDFNNGDVKKTNMSKGDKRKVQAVKESGVTQKQVGKGANSAWRSNQMRAIDCIVVKNVTKKLIDSKLYRCIFRDTDSDYRVVQSEDDQTNIVNKGIRLGNMLGRKLQVRNNDKSLKFNRLRSGKIDRRALSGLGYGAEAIFQKVLTSSHTPSCLHISIDASGSMGGQRWENSQIAAIAIAKAASMTTNLDVVISYRTVYYTGGNNCKPLVVIGYDSRKDKMSKITSLFKYFTPRGTTPAGLCFEAILKDITEMGDNNTDKYFINFSDGEPYFSTKGFDYWGNLADKHTQSQVNKMKASGVKVLSYYIGGKNVGDQTRSDFDYKYGKESTEYVTVTDIVPLAKTLNKKFIEA